MAHTKAGSAQEFENYSHEGKFCASDALTAQPKSISTTKAAHPLAKQRLFSNCLCVRVGGQPMSQVASCLLEVGGPRYLAAGLGLIGAGASVGSPCRAFSGVMGSVRT